ncbi:MAG TPA: TIGR03435 family protein [Bryobacteraceae bacterium]|nr:TIGR03435 family protein [Bryobacteraceae bacterium]
MVIFVAAVGSHFVCAQESGGPRFELASVKLVNGDALYPATGLSGGPGTSDPERITYWGSVFRLLPMVYGVDFDQMTGGPSWLLSQQYSISAIVPRGATAEEVRIMWQNLLAERFNFKMHFVKKDLPVYELSVAPGGTKLKKSGKGPPTPAAGFPVPGPGRRQAFSNAPPRNARITFRDTSIAEFIDLLGPTLASLGDLAGIANARIIDKTGLEGRFDFTLEYDGTVGARGAMYPPLPEGTLGSAPPLPDAVREQLGLKLEEKKARFDVLVVDRFDKIPTGN